MDVYRQIEEEGRALFPDQYAADAELQEIVRKGRELDRGREAGAWLSPVFAVWAIGAAVAIAVWVAVSAIEADSFQRVTGRHVSTWDAMFLSLRVDENPQNPATPGED